MTALVLILIALLVLAAGLAAVVFLIVLARRAKSRTPATLPSPAPGGHGEPNQPTKP